MNKSKKATTKNKWKIAPISSLYFQFPPSTLLFFLLFLCNSTFQIISADYSYKIQSGCMIFWGLKLLLTGLGRSCWDTSPVRVPRVKSWLHLSFQFAHPRRGHRSRLKLLGPSTHLGDLHWVSGALFCSGWAYPGPLWAFECGRFLSVCPPSQQESRKGTGCIHTLLLQPVLRIRLNYLNKRKAGSEPTHLWWVTNDTVISGLIVPRHLKCHLFMMVLILPPFSVLDNKFLSCTAFR